LRIVGGKYKGRTLLEFKGKDIRPTSDMTRESLFNILQFKIYGKTFLDLYSGSGAVGIEALSRGAGKVVFNDLDRTSVSLIKQNLVKLGVLESYQVINSDAVTLLKSKESEFDYIYIDPPWTSCDYLQILNACVGALKDGGVAIFESQTKMQETHPDLTLFDERRYGRAHLTFYRKGEEL
jgi:16S rRNA (guanine966-N2)-methyltransferase